MEDFLINKALYKFFEKSLSFGSWALMITLNAMKNVLQSHPLNGTCQVLSVNTNSSTIELDYKVKINN